MNDVGRHFEAEELDGPLLGLFTRLIARFATALVIPVSGLILIPG